MSESDGEFQWTVRRGGDVGALATNGHDADERRTNEAPDELPPLWRYKWEDSLNGPLPERAGALTDQIVGTIGQTLESGTGLPLIAVRGDLGSGKSTLRDLLINEIRVTSSLASGPVHEIHVVEAGDRETGAEFARRVGNLAVGAPVVALARSSTWEVTLSELSRRRNPLVPSATATLLPFRDTAANVFAHCLERVRRSVGLPLDRLKELEAEAKLLPDFLATPFYFGLIAQALVDRSGSAPARSSVLDCFRVSLESRMGETTVAELVELARGSRGGGRLRTVVQGIVEEDGFRHDGYRNLVLAIAVVDGMLTLDELGASSNAVPAFRVLLEHLRSMALDDRYELQGRLAQFVENGAPDERILNPLYLQAAAAVAIDSIDRAAGQREVVRERCMRLLRAREDVARRVESADLRLIEAYEGPELSWDISDALTQVGDPRIDGGQDMARFTEIGPVAVSIGTDHPVDRSDEAKPVQPYARQEVEIGPVFVANFLVTNAEYDEFLRSDPEYYYDDAGRQWVEENSELLHSIEGSFDLVAPRCFWKELEVEAAGNGRYADLPSALKVARSRATRGDAAMLKDADSAADERFSAPGKPVVGVTWWDAIAYCNWWEERWLPSLGLGPGARVSLLADWEWEALRRTCFSGGSNSDVEQQIARRSFPTHLRTVKQPRGRAAAMRLFQPAHVGIFPRPLGEGPYDLVGNVWEWTRSQVFGRIVRDPDASSDAPFGGTSWSDIDLEHERAARAEGRDDLDSADPLAYRAVRGGSWFSSDESAAWDPAYRLCDPPYSSYWDLGFRIAIYPEGLPIG